ncbi:MAG: protein translocase subunit SecD [Candidatus Berkelbacteria bacterium]|nr:protein translocase subunit SecD [Candidatus Berkelbacteria bacterium]
MKNHLFSFIGIIVILVAAIFIVIPNGPNVFSKETKMHLGLDLQGGVQLLYSIDISNLNGKTPQEIQNQTVDLITRRVDDLGVSEPQIQGTKIGSQFGVLVELPGIKDIDQAKQLIGKTAQLKFYELGPDGSEISTDLIGSDVSKASAGTDKNQSGFSSVAPVIYLEFTPDGAKKFQEITKRNVGKIIITKLDNEVINEATVQTEISGGKAQIDGIKTIKEARDTAQLISEGSLPAPINLVQENQVGASLGKDAVEKSLVAGIFGLVLVAVFMVIYYRGLGVAAVGALLIYTLIVVSLFKLIPITLTLAGIAGFIFSIGAAVDANILIFERFKEEDKKGLPRTQALENGFTRSWPSIRDSNIASLITATILFYMSTGLVKGFALTLAIGIFVSLFTSIIVTRNILRFFIKNKQES